MGIIQGDAKHGIILVQQMEQDKEYPVFMWGLKFTLIKDHHGILHIFNKVPKEVKMKLR